jgi:RNA polymerase sigma-70 factor
MPNDSTLASLDGFLAHHRDLIRSLYAEGVYARWGLREEPFAEGLRRSAAKRFAGATAAPAEIETYLRSLRLEDLALACACIEGIDSAWEFFIATFSQDLRRGAAAMLRSSGYADDARADDLADSIYADLYGVRSGSGGARKSLFEYFHGRSKLSTWLRAVLAQRQVDLLRTSGRTVSLDAGNESDVSAELATRTEPVCADPDREKYLGRVDRSLSAALVDLAPRERLILACYYVDQITLAEIGRMLHEHESTVSRQLERIRRSLRESVTRALQREIPANDGRPAEAALDAAQVELAFEYAVEDWPFDLSRVLATATSPAEDPPEK